MSAPATILDRFMLNKQHNDCTDKHYCHASLIRIAAGSLIVYKASFFIITFMNDTDLKTLHLVCFTLPDVLLSSFIPLSRSSHLHSLETALHHEFAIGSGTNHTIVLENFIIVSYIQGCALFVGVKSQMENMNRLLL